MTTVRPAPEITLTHGNHVVRLVPTLRAATILEQQEGGFPGLLDRLRDLHTATIKAVIIAGASCRTSADAFLTAMQDKPLLTIQNAALPACLAFLTAIMAPDLTDTDKTAPTRATGKPVAWADLYSELFGIGTGWLGWSAAETWNATIPEIVSAFEAHTKKLQAIYGGAEEPTSGSSGTSKEQREANIAAGLDPDFDRAGLHALKARHT